MPTDEKIDALIRDVAEKTRVDRELREKAKEAQETSSRASSARITAYEALSREIEDRVNGAAEAAPSTPSVVHHLHIDGKKVAKAGGADDYGASA